VGYLNNTDLFIEGYQEHPNIINNIFFCAKEKERWWWEA